MKYAEHYFMGIPVYIDHRLTSRRKPMFRIGPGIVMAFWFYHTRFDADGTLLPRDFSLLEVSDVSN